MENDPIKNIEEAIQKAAQLHRSGQDGTEEGQPFSTERLEESIELLHQVAQIDREQATDRLRERLEDLKQAKKRARRRLWMSISGMAAAMTVAFVGIYLLWGEEQPKKTEVPVVKLEKITVPTLLHERNETVVAQQPLDLKETAKTYVVAQQEVTEQMQEEEVLRTEIVVIPAGYTYTVKLADGSTVVLNAGSELRFPNRFTDSVRSVELKGEAYFTVAKSNVPFVVKAGDTQVKVYGTQFNLLYSEELKLSEAVLVEGRIGMSAGGQEVKILPNQRVYRRAGADLQTEEADPANYTGWMGKSFKYNDVRLDRIVYDIACWYGLKIRLAPELKEQTYSLEFDKSASGDWAVRVLEIMTGKQVEKEGGVYYIK